MHPTYFRVAGQNRRGHFVGTGRREGRTGCQVGGVERSERCWGLAQLGRPAPTRATAHRGSWHLTGWSPWLPCERRALMCCELTMHRLP